MPSLEVTLEALRENAHLTFKASKEAEQKAREALEKYKEADQKFNSAEQQFNEIVRKNIENGPAITNNDIDLQERVMINCINASDMAIKTANNFSKAKQIAVEKLEVATVASNKLETALNTAGEKNVS